MPASGLPWTISGSASNISFSAAPLLRSVLRIRPSVASAWTWAYQSGSLAAARAISSSTVTSPRS